MKTLNDLLQQKAERIQKRQRANAPPAIVGSEFTLSDLINIRQLATLQGYTDYWFQIAQHLPSTDPHILLRRDFEIAWIIRNGGGALEVSMAYGMSLRSAKKAIERFWKRQTPEMVQWIDKRFTKYRRPGL